MSAVLARPASPLAAPAATAGVSPAAWRRGLLVAGCAAAVGLAAAVGRPEAALQADPDLARLLRGMAAIKGALVASAIGLLWWRLGRPLRAGTALAGLAGVWLMAGASTLVWQLTLVPLAALLFHAGEFTVLFAAWREHRAERAFDRPVAVEVAAGEPRARPQPASPPPAGNTSSSSWRKWAFVSSKTLR